ncbi:DUF3710 domain-containing protein [Actinomadura craniellae]|uniref:DUF3710 domain-containing protein n=1 Tax=Actinomadura craniellae TaxID=2231787 RepID=A0A365GXQ0_9ACTN|nr:DUF3710 domain-containing protein [Actinomadura craniellae]RAY11615.1 DUF3710 domain-containing protein [Actinomadura craniellae]
MGFRRRREAEAPDENLEPTDEQSDEVEETEEVAAVEGGPWDSEDAYPEMQRLDFGAFQVPVAQGLGFQVNFEATEVDEEGNPVNGRPVAVLVQHSESMLQIQAFAAPKRSGIWAEIRRETSQEIVEQGGGQVQDEEGPFGPELLAMIPAPLTPEVLEQMPPELREQIPAEFIEQGWAPQIIRFLGVDGPRWFLQGVVQGAAIEDEEQWQVLEDVFRNIVVNRGEQPMPPRELLELTLPQEFTEGAEAEEEEAEEMLDPFERGPEITEVR